MPAGQSKESFHLMNYPELRMNGLTFYLNISEMIYMR